MKLFRNIFLLGLSIIISYVAAPLFAETYSNYFSSGSIGAIDFSAVLGVPLGFIFFLTLTLTAFGDDKKYWWIGIGLIPAAAFELYFDLDHIYIPILIGILGWILGWLISKVMNLTK